MRVSDSTPVCSSTVAEMSRRQMDNIDVVAMEVATSLGQVSIAATNNPHSMASRMAADHLNVLSSEKRSSLEWIDRIPFGHDFLSWLSDELSKKELFLLNTHEVDM